mmetsp:Transcript_1864/g.7484  ORF Transcript_1864/g.7484 Transcript_1864/m.7484 type:complete len:220 (-) Transcript_1864:8-667(-)
MKSSSRFALPEARNARIASPTRSSRYHSGACAVSTSLYPACSAHFVAVAVMSPSPAVPNPTRGILCPEFNTTCPIARGSSDLVSSAPIAGESPHSPQLSLQRSSMNAGFFAHSPLEAQPAQFSARSEQGESFSNASSRTMSWSWWTMRRDGTISGFGGWGGGSEGGGGLSSNAETSNGSSMTGSDSSMSGVFSVVSTSTGAASSGRSNPNELSISFSAL